MICTPPTAGTCARVRGRPTATSRQRDLSWERARKIADALPADDPSRAAMRIAPRTMLCGTAFRVHADISGGRLRRIAAVVHRSRGQGVAGHRHGRADDRSLVSWPGARGVAAGIRNIGAGRVDRRSDARLSGCPSWRSTPSFRAARSAEALRWSQTVIDLADGDPTKGNFIIGSPLALALGHARHRPMGAGPSRMARRLHQALAMARSADPMSHARVITFTYGFAIAGGVLLADDAAMRDIEGALADHRTIQ